MSEANIKQIVPHKKMPAELQITAEQILMEAYEYKDTPLKSTRHKIEDIEELYEYQGRKRTEYENALRRNRFNYGQWMRYGQFEIDQHDFPRARSVFERALEVDHSNIPLWIRYIQCEIKGKNINHARNLLDRATRVLPRVDKLWYQYVTVEESVGNIIATRSIFNNWLKWKPGPEVWRHYIQFEIRYNEFDNARLIFEKFVVVKPDSNTWISWAEFEKQHGDSINVRNVFKLSINSLLSINALDAKMLISWIQWEITQRGWNQVRELFKFGFERLTETEKLKLQDKYTQFEKQFGEKQDIESSVLEKRKQKYEQELKSNASDYETWWTYIKLVENYPPSFTLEDRRQVYEQCISNVPDSNEKSSWLSYIYLWLRYLTWAENQIKDTNTTRSLYQRILKLIPHKRFTIARIWVMFAEFEIRQGDLTKARKILGRSLGLCPNLRIIKYYIKLETELKEFDRVRMIYNKLLSSFPNESSNWIEFATLESALGDEPRCIAIFNLGINEESIPKTERLKLLRSFIKHQLDEYNFDEARNLYERLVKESNNDLKTWISRCFLELQIPTDEQLQKHARMIEQTGDNELEFHFEITEEAKDRSRDVFNKAIKVFKDTSNQNRVVLLEALKNFETKYGTSETVSEVEKRLPRLVKKFRTNETGATEEEYIEYIFLEDQLEQEEEANLFKAQFTDRFFQDLEDDKNLLKIKTEEDSNTVSKIEKDTEEINQPKPTFRSRFEEDGEDADEEDECPTSKAIFENRFENDKDRDNELKPNSFSRKFEE